MIKKLIYIDGIGNITLEKKPRQKSLRLRIHPEKGVFVSVPLHITEAQAKSFVIRNSQWLNEKLIYIEKCKNEGLFTKDSVFKSRRYELIIERHEDNAGDHGKAEVTLGKINISIPEYLDIRDMGVQNFFQKVISQALWVEAVEILPEKVEKVADLFGFKYKKLKIGKSNSTWGSCKPDNTITLTSKLMLLSDELINFIILHELCHTVHKNHSEKFHQLLDSCVGGKSKFYHKQLRKIKKKIVPGDYSYTQ